MILEKLGWNPERAAVFTSSANRGFVPARVARQDRAGYVVWNNDGLHPAQLSGRLRYKLADEVNLVAVGDWVAIDQQGGTTTIKEVLPRTTTCVRKSADAVTSAQIIATNVDWLLLVSGLDGDFNPRRIERYLSFAWNSGCPSQKLRRPCQVGTYVAGQTGSLSLRWPLTNSELRVSHDVHELGRLRPLADADAHRTRR